MGETIEPGTLYVVSTPIGNLEDVTLRAIRILSGVDLIAAEDTRTTRVLLSRLSIQKPLVSYHRHNENSRTPGLIADLAAGRTVAVVTDAGTPGISDPAYTIIKAAIDHGVRVVPVPGPTAFLPALIVSGLPMDRFVFEGFLPVKKGRKKRLEQLRTEERTIIFYESPYRIERTLKDIVDLVGDREIALAREITKKFEEVLRGKASSVLAQVRARSLKGEIVLVLRGSAGKGRTRDDGTTSSGE